MLHKSQNHARRDLGEFKPMRGAFLLLEMQTTREDGSLGKLLRYNAPEDGDLCNLDGRGLWELATQFVY